MRAAATNSVIPDNLLTICVDSGFGGGGQSYGDMSPEAPNVTTDAHGAMVIVPGGIVVGGFTQANGGEEEFSAAKERIDLLYADDFE